MIADEAQHRMLIQLPKEMHARLRLCAASNERRMTAEIRFALKAHLAAHGFPKQEEDDGAPV